MPAISSKRYDQLAKLQALPPSEYDPHPGVGGVLLSDEILYYVEHHHLITPFNQENLKPAGYELTIGDEYFLNGKFHTLDPLSNDNTIIRIPHSRWLF